MRREIRFSAVIAIPHVVNCDFVAINLRPSCLRDIGLPGAIVARLQSKPPHRNQRECCKDDHELQQFSANKNSGRQQNEQEQNRCKRASRPEIIIERTGRPGCTNECNQLGECPANVFDDAHAKHGLNAASLMRYSADIASASHSSSVGCHVLSGLFGTAGLTPKVQHRVGLPWRSAAKRWAKQSVTMGYASQKGRNRPPQLTENRTTVGTQHQLQEQRLSSARLSPLVSC